MSMRKRFHRNRFQQAILACAAAACLLVPSPSTHASSVMMLSGSVASAIAKYFGKEGAEEAAEYLAKKGGKEIAERVASKAAQHGGDEAVEQLAKYVGKHGPDALRALDNVPAVGPILNALDEIPEAQLKAALARLAAGTPGRELAEAVGKHGSKALASELKHPGVGLALVRALGDDGAELAAKMTSEQAIALAKHADDIAKLPIAQRNGLVSLIGKDMGKVVGFLGDFVKANPTKTLFTVATTTVILAEPERILGGDEIAFDADGNPVLISKKGIAGRTIEATGAAAKHVSDGYVQPVFKTALAFIATFFALWLGLKLWHAHKREQLKTQTLQDEQTNTETVEALGVTPKERAQPSATTPSSDDTNQVASSNKHDAT